MKTIINKTSFNEDQDDFFMLQSTKIIYGEEVELSTTEYELIRDNQNFDINILEFDAEKVQESMEPESQNNDTINIILEELEIFDAIYTQLTSRYPNESIIESTNIVYKNVRERIDNDIARKTAVRESDSNSGGVQKA